MNAPKKISALIVDDSRVARDFLSHIFSEAGIDVIGTVPGGKEAVEFVKLRKPDIITMDIYMPGMNGIETTRRIMETNPVPVIIVSGNWDPAEVETTFRAMEAGALSVVRRPRGIGHPEHDISVRELVKTVRLMSEIKMVRRWPMSNRAKEKDVPESVNMPAEREIKIVAIGASAGGPPVLRTILSRLDAGFPYPVMVVQHIAAGFLSGMLDWLGQTSRIPVRIAKEAEEIRPGVAYFAPDGFQMGVDGTGTIYLSSGEQENGARPSISYLFRSVASAYNGNAAAVLLTGMGRDGAQEMKLLKARGAFTIAQDKESSAVYGIPGVAVEMGAAALVLPPEQIADALNSFAKKSFKENGK